MASSVKLQGTGLYQDTTEVLDLKTNGSVKTHAAMASSGSITAGSLVSTGSLAAVTASFSGDLTVSGFTAMSGNVHIVGDLDVAGAINSVTKTTSILEVEDINIIMASGSNASAADGGGIIIGGYAAGNAAASVLWDDTNSALDFNIGSTTEMRLAAGALLPEANNDIDLGSDDNEFKDLWLDGVAYIDTLNASALGANLDHANFNSTNVDINSGAIDGTVIGAASAAAGSFTTVAASSTVTSAGRMICDDTTDASSKTDGSLQTDGGLSVAKKAYVGTGLTVEAGGIEVDAGDVNIDSTTAASSKTTGALKVAGGISAQLKGHFGTGLTTDSGGLTVTAGGVEVSAGRVIIDDTTAATSTTDGALACGGGLSVAADAVIGDDLMLLSDSAVLSLGADSDATFTHDGTTGLTIAASPISIDSTGEMHLNSTTGDIKFQDGGTDQLALDMDGTAGEVIMKLMVNSDDFVFQQYDGTEVFRVEDNGDFDVAGGFGSTGVTISSAGNLSVDGISTLGATTGVVVSAAGAVAVNNATDSTAVTNGSLQTDGGLGVTLDATFGNDVKLLSDSAVLSFGADSDVTLTHTDDTGLTLNGTNKLMFGRATTLIQESSANALMLGALGSITAAAPTVAITATTAMTLNDGSNTAKLRINGASANYGLNLPNTATSGEAQARSWITFSDGTLKKNIEPMANGLEKVMAMQPVTYQYKSGGGQEVGFVAQQMQEVVPEVVYGSGDGNLGIDYSKITSVLVEAIKTQQEQIEDLKSVVVKLSDNS